jgi:hypothetical protein
MKVERLMPAPEHRTQFAWSHHVTVPEQPGCYALATYAGDVLYVGLATTSIRSRVGTHLDTRLKRQGTEIGVPFWVHYLVRPAADVNRIERGWMNLAILEDGEMPPLNRVYSPL